MPTRSKFRPEKGFLFKVVYKDKEFKRKMAETVIKNRIKPYPDELFTSWLARNATINYLQTPTFVNYYFPEYKNKLLSRDADVYVDEKIAENFEKRMLLRTKEVFRTSLQSYAGYLHETILSNGRNHLISPVKIRGRYPRLKGLRYCPECLKEKEYFRKEWRLSFYAACPKHRSFMIDACPNCGEPIFLTKRKLDVESFNCWNCGFVYKEAEAEKLHPDSFGAEYLSQAMEILRKGYFIWNGKWYYSPFYFRILKQIARLIVQFDYRFWDVFERERDYHGIEVRDSDVFKGASLEETLTLKESFAVFIGAISVMSNPYSLRRFIEQNRIAVYNLNRDLDYLPFFYEKEIKKYYRQNRYVTDEEIRNACEWMRKNGREPSYLGCRNFWGSLWKRGKELNYQCLLVK